MRVRRGRDSTIHCFSIKLGGDGCAKIIKKYLLTQMQIHYIINTLLMKSLYTYLDSFSLPYTRFHVKHYE